MLEAATSRTAAVGVSSQSDWLQPTWSRVSRYVSQEVEDESNKGVFGFWLWVEEKERDGI